MQQNHKGAGMKFFIIAGESSGDVHGANLAKNFRFMKRWPVVSHFMSPFGGVTAVNAHGRIARNARIYKGFGTSAHFG